MLTKLTLKHFLKNLTTRVRHKAQHLGRDKGRAVVLLTQTVPACPGYRSVEA